MYQFVRAGNIVKISLSLRDLKLLRAHGWEFVYLPGRQPTPTINAGRTATCVIFTKRAIGLHHMRIQTPDALYRFLKTKYKR